MKKINFIILVFFVYFIFFARCEKAKADDADLYLDACKKAEQNSLVTDPAKPWAVDQLKTIQGSGSGDGNTYVNNGGSYKIIAGTYVKEVNYTGYHSMQDTTVYGKSPKTDAMWITTGSELNNYIRNTAGINSSNVQAEAARILGINTNSTNNMVVEVLAEPSNDYIMRPTKNPNITSYSKTSFTLPTENFVQPSGMDATAYDNFKGYYDNWKNTAYGSDTRKKFPWTQYGYTYKWGYGDTLNDIKGLSEFIILAKTNITIYGMYSIQSYLYTTGNGSSVFNVTGNLDTLWAGSKFQPTTNTDGSAKKTGNPDNLASDPGDYLVQIENNSTVSEGEGILVYSPGFIVENKGTITGATTEKFGLGASTKNVAILFKGDSTFGGSGNNYLINTGTIQSPGTAVEIWNGDTIINNTGGLIQGYKYAIKTEGGGANVALKGGIIDGIIDFSDGTGTLTMNGNTSFAFNVSPTSSRFIQNVGTIDFGNQNITLRPTATGFIGNNQTFTVASAATAINNLDTSKVTINAISNILSDIVNFSTVSQSGSNMILTSSRNLNWYSNNSQNRSLGSALDYAASLNGGGLSNALFLLDSSNDPAGNSSQLEPVNQTAAYNTAFYSVAAFINAYTERLKRLRLDGCFNKDCQPYDSNCKQGDNPLYDIKIGENGELFANGYSYWTNFDSNNNAPGFNSISGGYISGIGGRIGKASHGEVIFGIANAHTDYDNNVANLKDTVYRVGPYSSFLLPGDFYLDTLATYGFHDATTKRNINYLSRTANADYEMNEAIGFLGLTKIFNFDDGFKLMPYANIQYFFLNRSNYSESGASDVNLVVNKSSANSLLTRLGATFIKDFKFKNLIIRPDATAAWWCECLNPNTDIKSSFISTPGTEFSTAQGNINKNSARIGVGLSFFGEKCKTPMSLYTRYDGVLGKTGVFSSITAGVRFAI